ncbi:hypothetical protein COO91_10433 (plasmid) [Nostoc flagelliforme CCNUN1]|uniref:Uncharacterized protein n=1 Tax=Nostoc flagelliforme CCNUN1 TaxID=2038116 RepID=A0A2K8T981_9NOSO|nr:hypothetical protein COO91_10433 [Nostoc flagelliforme CCNUN1]
MKKAVLAGGSVGFYVLPQLGIQTPPEQGRLNEVQEGS